VPGNEHLRDSNIKYLRSSATNFLLARCYAVRAGGVRSPDGAARCMSGPGRGFRVILGYRCKDAQTRAGLYSKKAPRGEIALFIFSAFSFEHVLCTLERSDEVVELCSAKPRGVRRPLLGLVLLARNDLDLDWPIDIEIMGSGIHRKSKKVLKMVAHGLTF